MVEKRKGYKRFSVTADRKNIKRLDHLIDKRKVFWSYSHAFMTLFLFWEKFHTKEGEPRLILPRGENIIEQVLKRVKKD